MRETRETAWNCKLFARQGANKRNELEELLQSGCQENEKNAKPNKTQVPCGNDGGTRLNN